MVNSENIKLLLWENIHGETISEIALEKYRLKCANGVTGSINKIIIH